MKIMINGQLRRFDKTITIPELLAELALEPRRVAIERNGKIVPRARYDETELAENDQLEIVSLVGGG